jgi:hypothetical protein
MKRLVTNIKQVFIFVYVFLVYFAQYTEGSPFHFELDNKYKKKLPFKCGCIQTAVLLYVKNYFTVMKCN